VTRAIARSLAVAVTIRAGALALAQAPPQAQSRPSPRAAAPIDLTGYWVSVVTEDWRWRMLTAPKGDYASVPLNPEGIRVAGTWDPAKAAGDGCKAYGVAAIMREPGRLHIRWDNDSTLKIETDAGQQTRLLHFDTPQKTRGARTWQGQSEAEWESLGARGGPPASRAGSLKVVTTDFRAGYLRKNGVPYSEDAVVTEYYDRLVSSGSEWLTVLTIVDDPRYLSQPFVTSTHFKQESDAAGWSPAACETSPR
jgi:hypothetical protein